MKYLPFVNFDIRTGLDSDEILRRLRAAINAERKGLIFSYKNFIGDVDKYHFRIWRNTWWNHHSMPIVSGKIQSEEPGCHLQISMRMPWFGFLFYSSIFGFLWFSFFMGQANLVVEKVQTGTWQFESLWEWLLSVVLGIVFLAIIYFMSVGAFKWEAYQAIIYLLRLVRAEKDNIVYHDQIL